jgi:hypothetical protein
MDNTDKIEMILRQTNYTREEATTMLQECNGDVALVIKRFFGLKDKKEELPAFKSKNQEMYRQFRTKLNIVGQMPEPNL